MTFTPSQYQQAIYDAIANTSDNLLIEAVAGSGKTTTIIEGVNYLPQGLRIGFMAFNKHIVAELKQRIQRPDVEITTLNAFGHRVCQQAMRPTFNKDKVRKWIETTTPRMGHTINDINKIIMLLKSRGCREDYYTLSSVEFAKEIKELAKYHAEEWPSDEAQFTELLRDTYRWSIETKNIIDFSDQIFMPLHYDLPIDPYDVLLVDETQDFTPAQIDLIQRAGQRIIAVGDEKQSIYGFRGAEIDAMTRMRNELQMHKLPLSISYRCPTSHVNVASRFVSQIQSAPGAPRGEIAHITWSDLYTHAQPGDYIVCRMNAPMIQACFRFIKQGKKASINGKDFGLSLKRFITKACRYNEKYLKKDQIPHLAIQEPFAAWFETYAYDEHERLRKLERSTAVHDDMAQCVRTFMDHANTVRDIFTQIDEIFSDRQCPGVTLSTIHKAKGLEAETVYILLPEKMPCWFVKQAWQELQEFNLMYVACTRAKQTLVFVVDDNEEDGARWTLDQYIPETPEPKWKKTQGEQI